MPRLYEGRLAYFAYSFLYYLTLQQQVFEALQRSQLYTRFFASLMFVVFPVNPLFCVLTNKSIALQLYCVRFWPFVGAFLCHEVFNLNSCVLFREIFPYFALVFSLHEAYYYYQYLFDSFSISDQYALCFSCLYRSLVIRLFAPDFPLNYGHVFAALFVMLCVAIAKFVDHTLGRLSLFLLVLIDFNYKRIKGRGVWEILVQSIEYVMAEARREMSHIRIG